MDLEVLPIVLIISGFIGLYSSVMNRNPLQVVKLSLQGKNPSEAAPITTLAPPRNTATAPPVNVPSSNTAPRPTFVTPKYDRPPDGNSGLRYV